MGFVDKLFSRGFVHVGDMDFERYIYTEPLCSTNAGPKATLERIAVSSGKVSFWVPAKKRLAPMKHAAYPTAKSC